MIHLVTGDSGFIGRHLVTQLTKSRPQDEIIGVSTRHNSDHGAKHRVADLSDLKAAENLIEECRPDWIYHLAGSAKVQASVGLPEYFRSNFLTTTNLLKALAQTKRPQRLFLASSVHVYGNQNDVVMESVPLEPVGHYGFTKYLAERAVEEFTKAHPSCTAVIGRLYSCIGPGQPAGFVTSDMARKLAALSPHSDQPLKTGPLDAIRRFLDVRDAVKIFPALLETALPGTTTVNIASPFELTIRELVEMLIQVSGRRCAIETHEELHANPFRGLRVSPDKLVKLLPGVEFRPMKETLRDIWNSVESD